jgi:murein L,D-transpeptidase YcbB/YkuD
MMFSLVLLLSLSLNDAVARLHRGEELRIGAEEICARRAVADFYLGRDLAPAWTTEAGGDLLEFIRSMDTEGLDPQHYHLQALSAPLELEERELLLTDAYLLLASHLLTGRVDPETIVPTWCLPSREADLPRLLADALGRGDVAGSLRELFSPHPAYAGLREALQSYRAIAAAGGWSAVEAGPSLRRDSTGPRVDALIGLLRLMGDLSAPATSFDDSVEAAVRRYQWRNGLEVDGVVGPATLRSMQIPVEDRIRQIEVNLERWRWLPKSLGDRYAVLNIAAFELQVIDGGVRLSMRVIVGKDFQKTPVFSSQIERVIFSPYWNVPDSIAAREIAPAVRRDPRYLAREHMERVAGGGYRQKPGPWNALGGIKFDIPNRYTVYLHDTPAKALFARPMRAFSHGCMRIEKPLELAEYLLTGQPEWTRARIEQAASSRREQAVRVRNPLPVHVLYWTAWVDGSGVLHLRDDVYERDASLYAAMKREP